MDTVFGDLLPTPAARVRALGDTGQVDLGGGRVLTSTWSPGHAAHHVGLLDSLTGDLYVGDAVGVYVPEVAVLRPATPPPDFDLALALASLDAFADLRPTRLLFSHYGPVDAVEQTLADSAEELELWVEQARRTRDEGLDLDHAVAAVRERTAERYAAVRNDPSLRDKHDLLASEAFTLSGILRWLDRVDPPPG